MLHNNSVMSSLVGIANWAQRMSEMIYSHQAEIGVTKMMEFLSCKSEGEYSATGPERRWEWAGGKALDWVVSLQVIGTSTDVDLYVSFKVNGDNKEEEEWG